MDLPAQQEEREQRLAHEGLRRGQRPQRGAFERLQMKWKMYCKLRMASEEPEAAAVSAFCCRRMGRPLVQPSTIKHSTNSRCRNS